MKTTKSFIGNLCLLQLMFMAICACGNVKSNSQDTTQATANAAEEAKEQGTVFYKISLEEALEKAKTEGKFVLIDFHTKTCGPCRKMEKEVFPNPICGEFVNKHFVPIMIDGEDGGRGQEIAKGQKIFIYPTYAILQSDGFKEGEIMGAEYDVNKFLDMLKSIIKVE